MSTEAPGVVVDLAALLGGRFASEDAVSDTTEVKSDADLLAHCAMVVTIRADIYP